MKKIRQCIVCGEIKPIHAKDKCKKCYNRENAREEKQRLHRKEYRKSIKGIEVNRKYEQSQKRQERKREYIKQYCEIHKEELQEYQKRYRESEQGKANIKKGNKKYRALKKEAVIKGEVVDIKILYDKFNGICQKCGCKCNWNDKKVITRKDGIKTFVVGRTYPTHDHIIPLSKKGFEGYDNAQLLCFSCNSSKKNNNIDKEQS